MTLASPTWHPVVRSDEVRAGDNIVAGFINGAELALWRAADGAAQAWDNRCPHRSVRFTLGQVMGDRLSCAYHGWQYAAGTGQCAGIPAHPAMTPPRNVCAKVFRSVEAAGMVWVSLDPQAEPPALDGVVPGGWHFCRTLGVRAEADVAQAALVSHGLKAGSASDWRGNLDGIPVVALVLAAQPGLSFIHVWTEAAPDSAAMKTLHKAVRRLRTDIETVKG